MAERKKQRDTRIKRARKTSSALCWKNDRLRRAMSELVAAVEASSATEELAKAVATAKAAIEADE